MFLLAQLFFAEGNSYLSLIFKKVERKLLELHAFFELQLIPEFSQKSRLTVNSKAYQKTSYFVSKSCFLEVKSCSLAKTNYLLKGIDFLARQD
jgi:hypothetical protein